MTDAGADLVAIGRIAGPFGLHGEARLTGADPNDVNAGLRVSVRRADGSESDFSIKAVRRHKGGVLVRFFGIDGRTGVEALRGADVFAKRSDLPPMPEGTFRDDELIGMSVIDARLGDLGAVREVLHYPHADMIVVGERSVLVPLLKAYRVVIDMAARTISTELPPGFEEL